MALIGTTSNELAGYRIVEYKGVVRGLERVCERARDEAFDATEFMQGSTEVLAYGTAVKVAKQ